MTWEQKLWDFICALYKQLGGNCNDLPPRPTNPSQIPGTLPDTIDELELRYNSVGMPNFPNEAARTFFENLLSDIESHLDLPANSLPSASDTQLRDLIDSIQGAMP